tara:strand:+ start:8555 stop:12040 length:3486 start_codon:yes stop_codon:yes gene_type:complete
MEDIKFVNLHAHSGVGSPFDGFGYPQEHMEYAYKNGSKALALTDHGNMNGLAYQVLHAKKMEKEGKDFKPIYGVEAYFIPSVKEWRVKLEEHKADKKKAKEISKEKSGTNIEEEGASKSAGRSELNRSRHVVLLAMNQTGLENIFKLVSLSHTKEYFYRKPRIDFKALEEHSEGVIALSACLGGIYAGCYWQNREQGEEAVLSCMRDMTQKMVDIFGDRWYGEIQWNRVPEQHELNKYVIQMHKEFGIPLVSTADSHYPTPQAWKDRELYKRLGWLGRTKPEWLDMELPTEVQELECELYPKNGQQMWEAYNYYSEKCGVKYDDKLVLDSIQETHRISFERIERYYPDDTIRLPDFVVPAGYTADDYLRRLASEGLFSLLKLNYPLSFGKKTKLRKDETILKYEQRLDHELKVIADRGFSKYFLTMKAISDKASHMMLAGPGRGSAAGSLVAYALGITQIDPIKHGLLFSRFLRSDAKDYPDIDYDVSDPMALKEILIKEWGSNTVVPISNWNTLQLRSLIKDISKFYGIPFKESNVVTNKMISEATPVAKKKHGIKAGVYVPTWEEVMEYSTSLQDFLKKYPVVEKHVKAMVGQYRSCSRHAGGVVVSENIDRYMPLIRSGDVMQTPWSEGQNVRQLEPMGFIKFDILGLSTLRMIESCIKRILIKEGKHNPTFADVMRFYSEKLHPDVLDTNNQEVYENVFHQGKWAGIFQFTEAGAQKFCQKVKPTSIVDISAVTSIFRPGPLSAGVDRDFMDARQNPEDIYYENEIVEDITKETYGFLIFQEQIALLAHKLGRNLSLDEGNLLRKLLTKKGTDKAKLKQDIRIKFISGSTEKGLSIEDAEDLWRRFEYFSGYGFNKSHAVCYSIVSYQCAWLMTYYEAEWLASYLDKETDKKKEKAIATAKSLGYSIHPVNINTSSRHWEVKGKTLYSPLSSIKGLGAAAMDQIIENRPFDTAEDFLFHPDVTYSKLNKKALDVLFRAGACQHLVDERFSGDKHFWSAAIVDRPKNKKKFKDNIDLYEGEGSFTTNEIISNMTTLTGVYPFEMIMNDDLRARLNDLNVVPISEYETALSVGSDWNVDDVLLVWFVPRSLKKKKTARGAEYWILEVIDENNIMTRIKCWGPKDKDKIEPNQPYMARIDYSAQWGFSTRSIHHNFRKIS